MIYLEYLVTAAVVVFLSIKASNYIDLLDKNTKLSGAFLGGVMLSAVTSLPELFTSISATVFFDRPAFCMGNILGSDLFNLMAISVIILFNLKGFAKGRISKSYRNVTLSVFLIYIFIALKFFNVVNVSLLNMSLTSILILLVYLLGAKYLAVANDVDTDEDALGYHASMTTNLSVKQIGFRFFISSVGIIAFSIMVTYLTDLIAVRLNLTQGLAGALLLGVATSLPEVTSTITLFRMKNYNIAVGNIIGSNLFNFIILTVADFLTKESVYVADEKILYLLLFGGIATPLFWLLLKNKNKRIIGACAGGIIACYAAFLLL